MSEAASDELIAATDVADLLVRSGVPFREAHGVVAGLVRTALDSGRPLSELTHEELAAHSEMLAAHAASSSEVLAAGAPGSSRRSPRAAPRRSACRSRSQLARERSIAGKRLRWRGRPATAASKLRSATVALTPTSTIARCSRSRAI